MLTVAPTHTHTLLSTDPFWLPTVGFEVNPACLARSRASLLSAAPDLLGTSVTFVDKDIRTATVNDSSDPHTIRAGPTTVVFLFLSRTGVATMASLLQACVDAGARVATYLHHVHLQGRCTSRLGGMLQMYQRDDSGEQEAVGHWQQQQAGSGTGHAQGLPAGFTVGAQAPCAVSGDTSGLARTCWKLEGSAPSPSARSGASSCSPYPASRQLCMGSPLHSAARDVCGVYSSPACESSSSDSDAEGDPCDESEVSLAACPTLWGEAEDTGRARHGGPSSRAPGTVPDTLSGATWRLAHSTLGWSDLVGSQ